MLEWLVNKWEAKTWITKMTNLRANNLIYFHFLDSNFCKGTCKKKMTNLPFQSSLVGGASIVQREIIRVGISLPILYRLNLLHIIILIWLHLSCGL